MDLALATTATHYAAEPPASDAGPPPTSKMLVAGGSEVVEVDPAVVEATCFPTQSCPFNSASERARRASSLVGQGHSCNRSHDYEAAAAHFLEASRLEPDRAAPLISHLNMRLKLARASGSSAELGLCAACYLRLLEARTLEPSEWTMVQSKLRDAQRAMIETRATQHAAATIQAVARGIVGRRRSSVRRERAAAARVVQASVLRRLRRTGCAVHSPLVSQVVLLRLPPPTPPPPPQQQ